jgi:hypothetical protein
MSRSVLLDPAVLDRSRPGQTPELRPGLIDVLTSAGKFRGRVDHQQARQLLASGLAEGIGRPIRFIQMKPDAPRETKYEWRRGTSDHTAVIMTDRSS